MQHHFQLTMTDILKRKHFEKAEIIAGEAGLQRAVKWVHILEVANVKTLLKGQELVLSTGLGWKEDPALFLSFLQELLEMQASGLCIDMTRHPFRIPQDIIRLANDHAFPILLFQQEVPYVEITHDIHSHLINQQYQMISNLEQYSQVLNKKLLSIRNCKEILELLQHHLGHTVVFQMNGNKKYVLPYENVERVKGVDERKTAHQCIQLLGQNYADLFIYTADEVTEYDTLILDRTATALAQHLLRDLYVEEKRRAEENEWVHSWLSGEHDEDEIMGFLVSHRMPHKPKGGTVCICKFQDLDTDFIYFKLLFRTIFEQFGFSALCTEKRNELAFVLLNNRDSKMRQRIESGLQRLMQSDFMKKQKLAVTIGVGKFSEQLEDFTKGFLTAKEAIKVQQNTGKQCHFYEDLHMYRLISMIHKHSDLQEIVLEYLDPVICYDQKYKGNLMETLRVYLACNGSKQETANRLFVVRQTLYHRITKLEQLLGADFMKPEKRLVIEFMLQAYDYLILTNRIKMYQ
ncbi:PucR family transcriptional regulator [Ectobacillus panaciterrae]|uniref:PucR family transcriptional regulator n=1 Tax=Ectobacillus panaciterrae TaxID=363872 RepID=UPI00041A664E|nr:PucR family transcriptional regulator [Ectobacillus panaciterrae]